MLCFFCAVGYLVMHCLWAVYVFFFCLIMFVFMSGCYLCIELLDDGGLTYCNVRFVIA